MDDPRTPAAHEPLARRIRELEAENAELRSRAALFQQMLENDLEIHHVVDAEARILYMSPSVEQVLGYRPEELVGTSSVELVHPDDLDPPMRLLGEHERHLGRFHFLEQRIRHRDGTWRRMEVAGKFATSPDGTPVVLVYSRDITRRREAEEERDRQLRAVERAVRAREEVMALVSHDLRNPIATVLLSASALLEAAPQGALRDGEREQLEAITRCCGEMNRLIEDLLDVTRIDEGGIPLTLASWTVTLIVQDALALARPLARERGVALTAQVDAGLPPVSVDRRRVMQVLSTLIANAIRFSDPGGAVALRAARHDGQVALHVADGGAGIPDEHLPFLFDPFRQGRQGRGSVGLGLAVSRGIVEGHGGSIWVQSRPGQGSTFSFTLPPAPGEA
jgi:PAS domain S-box-containing protein